jgi:hypothetical protein
VENSASNQFQCQFASGSWDVGCDNIGTRNIPGLIRDFSLFIPGFAYFAVVNLLESALASEHPDLLVSTGTAAQVGK